MDQTTNYGLNVPTLSDAPPDITKISENFTALDGLLKNQQDAIDACLPLAGGTMSGSISSTAEKVISTQAIPQGGQKELEFNASSGRVGYVRVENSEAAHKVSVAAVNFSDSSAAAISVAVDNLGNIATAAPTPATGDSSTKIATTAFVKAVIRDMIYPVGSIIFNADSWDPNERLGGTWERIADGRCLISAGSNYPAGSVGGSADAVVPYHTHSFNGTRANTEGHSNDHIHSGTTSGSGEGGAHRHLTVTYAQQDNGNMTSGSFLYSTGMGHSYENYILQAGGGEPNTGYTSVSNGMPNHAHGFSTGGVSANHTHAFTATGSNSYAGEAGNATGANMQPYVAVNIWKRTA